MAERPLLIMPVPQPADRTKLGGGGSLKRPSTGQQNARVSPMFRQLQEAFEARRAEFQQSMAGLEPEQVLVIDVFGDIEGFANAVRKIDGLEWLAEVEVDEIDPEFGFSDEKTPEKTLTGRLYLVMTNQRALQELLSLWQRYQDDPDMQFDRGLTRFRDVFRLMKTIRLWDVQDRLIETGIMDVWRAKIEQEGSETFLFEAELWYRKGDKLQGDSTRQVAELASQAGGRVVQQSVINEIAYHSLLLELPLHAIQSILDNPDTRLVKCERVMFFRPTGQVVFGEHSSDEETETTSFEEMPPPLGDPTLALFDGLPLANHRLLAGRLVVDDPDNWEEGYEASSRVHGSSMASLMIHGDLNQSQPPLPRPVYVRPIMRPVKSPLDRQPEGIPEDCMIVDLIHRAVRRLFEAGPGGDPVAPHVKVINLSIGDPALPFMRSMSPLARLLDWLSVKYRVLFIVSAGNHPATMSLDISRDELNALDAKELATITTKVLHRNIRHRKLLSPAETMNGITVGSIHHDASKVIHLRDRIDPFSEPMPSPVSAFGSGYRRAVKPDMTYYGGRQLYRQTLVPSDPVQIEPVAYTAPPGNKAAFPPEGNEIDPARTAYSCGTSNATALVSRSAGICHDSLREILGGQGVNFEGAPYEVPLLKALLVHGCSWAGIGERIEDVLGDSADKDQTREFISSWMGYGVLRPDYILGCTEQRATLLGYGALSDDEAHAFSIPLPPSLASRPEKRRLSITLAWLSPISVETQKYRTAQLWFETSARGDLTPEREEACEGRVGWRRVRRGTVQHEVFVGDSATPFNDGDSVKVKVNCRNDAGKIESPIAYGLAVSLEVAEGVDIAIYNEIRDRIVVAPQVTV